MKYRAVLTMGAFLAALATSADAQTAKHIWQYPTGTAGQTNDTIIIERAPSNAVPNATVCGVSPDPCTTLSVPLSALPYTNAVATNTALQALSPTVGQVVYREGFTTAGDGGAATYIYSGSSCSVSGAPNVAPGTLGDNGSQVASTVTTGCWKAQAQTYSPLMFGCAGDGHTDDTTCLQATFNAAVNREVSLGSHVYAVSGLTCANTMSVVGTQGNQTNANSGYGVSSGFRVTAGNQTVIKVANGCTGSIFQKIGLDTGETYNGTSFTPLLNSAGGGIAFIVPQNNITITDVNMFAPCLGIDMSGTQVFVQRVQITAVAGPTCGGIRVGHLTTGATSTDDRITDSTVQCLSDYSGAPNGAYGIRLEDAGGYSQTGDQTVLCGFGTQLIPGAGQVVCWVKLGSGYYGDSGVTALSIDTASASAVVKGVTAIDGWAATSSADNVTINNTSLGTVDGIHIIGLQDYNGQANGLSVGANVSHVTIDDSYFCGNGTASAASSVVFKNTIGGVTLRNNHLGGICDNQTGHTTAGITLIPTQAGVSQTYQMVIVGNNFDGVAAPINTGGLANGPAQDSVVSSNTVLDTEAPTLASTAGTVNLTGGYTNYVISSSSPVTTLGLPWNFRRVSLLTSNTAGMSFQVGGNICNALTTSVNQLVTATYLPPLSCWQLK